jgi:hypothetical protein
LQTHLKSLPIFMADRPQDYPASIVYGTMRDPVRAERALPVAGAARVLTLSVTGHMPA